MSAEIAQQWLNEVSATANRRDHAAHMNLISQRVSLTGVPGFDSIGYNDWSAQCQHEFENKLIESVQYQGLKIVAATDSRVMFKTYETVTATDGSVNAQGIEALLEKEEDGQWRLVQERVMDDEETAFSKLLPE